MEKTYLKTIVNWWYSTIEKQIAFYTRFDKGKPANLQYILDNKEMILDGLNDGFYGTLRELILYHLSMNPDISLFEEEFAVFSLNVNQNLQRVIEYGNLKQILYMSHFDQCWLHGSMMWCNQDCIKVKAANDKVTILYSSEYPNQLLKELDLMLDNIYITAKVKLISNKHNPDLMPCFNIGNTYRVKSIDKASAYRNICIENKVGNYDWVGIKDLELSKDEVCY